MNFYYGVVENRSDPLRLGRCQVRVVGLHTHDKSQLPTADLPWAVPVQPVTSAAMNGIGQSPIGPVEGTSVIIIFADESQQQPIIIGTVGGIPNAPAPVDADDSGPIAGSTKTENIELRTIPGPTNGRQLTLYDPETGATNLTSVLKANMKVLAFGIPAETFIVSINSGTQITISNAVVNYGENILKFEDPPTNLNAVSQSRVFENVLRDGSGNPVLSGSGTPVTTGSSASTPVKQTSTNTSIPTLPPAKSSSNPSKSAEGIKALIAACDKVGLTTKEQKCALLGIAGGESKWIPQLEAFNYSPNRLKQVYSFATPEDIATYSDATKKGVTREQFFSWAYGPTKLKGVESTRHPDFFLAAKKAVGVNTPDIAAIKQSYYEYFYGKEGTGGVEKDAGQPTPEPPKDGNDTTPRPSQKSIETGSFTTGFRDPNNKYPLKEYIGEPDTNRLARGIIEGTVVKRKDALRVRGIPRALDLGSWDQPEAPYGAKYPFNKVLETESGHIQEFDDTPGYERINTYHRSGTFSEIDPNGTQVNYIVGDNFVLMEKNGCVHVSGELNITVDGNANIYSRTDANIQVEQNATVRVGNNADIGVATDLTLAVGGDMKVKVAGDYSIQAANIYTKSDGVHDTQAVGALSVKGATTNVESEGTANYLSGGTTRMDYAQGQFGNGADGANDVENVPLTPPSLGVPINPVVPFTILPERQIEEKTVAETPDDYDTPEGRAASAEQARKEGVPNAPPPVASEEAPVIIKPSANAKEVPVDTSIIKTTKEFTNDYRLSKNFTLGMLIDGGVGGKHRLVDQMLKETKDGPEVLFTAQDIVANLALTAQNLLEPALEVLPGGIGGYKTQWRINSGYRLRGVVGNESPTSDHCKGRAVDIGILLPNKGQKTYEFVQALEKILPYDQIILEYRYPESIWIHMAYKAGGKRKMAFTMVNDKTYKRDAKGIPAGFVLLDNIPPKSA